MRATPVISLILIAMMTQPGVAERLPMLTEQPWAGYFVVHPQRKFNLVIQPDGAAMLLPVARRESVSRLRAIQIVPVVRETLANGQANERKIDPDGFSTTCEPTTNPTTVTYSGTSAGKGSFEITWRFEGEIVRVHGRILDPEALTNPMTLSIRVKVPDLDRTRGAQPDPRAKRDLFTLISPDGKQRLRPAEDLDPAAAGAIHGLTMKSFQYFGHEITFSQKGAGELALATRNSASLTDGFEITLTPDPTNPAPAELVIQVR
jgi:hypothetical protein